MAWDDDSVALLRKLWGDGLSAGQIALQMRGISRNAVLGKAMRLGLPGRITTSRIRSKHKKPRVRARLVWNNPTSPAARAFRSLQLPGEPLPPAQETDVGRKLLADLDDHFRECRWPCIEPSPGQPQMFCAAKAMEGLPYCEPHVRRAMAPPQPRYRAPAPAAPVPTFSDAVKEDA